MNIEDLPQWHFGEDEETANRTVEQILDGSKRMTSQVYDETYGQDAYPKVGDINVVTDWEGTPKCVIKTTSVQIINYANVPFETARLEQGDVSLEDWQISRGEVFEQQYGDLINGNTPLFLEIFEVVEYR
jgi:uncharacterized protein YhfF